MNGLIALRVFVLELGLTENDLLGAAQRAGLESFATIVDVESASQELMDSLNLGNKQALKLRRSAGQPLELLVAFPLRCNGIDTFSLRLVRLERLQDDRAAHKMNVNMAEPNRVDLWYDGPQNVTKPVEPVAVSMPLFARDRDRSKPIKKR